MSQSNVEHVSQVIADRTYGYIEMRIVARRRATFTPQIARRFCIPGECAETIAAMTMFKRRKEREQRNRKY